MTKPWKLKTNSSNILLVLITLILIEAKCAKGENVTNSLVEEVQPEHGGVQVYVGNDEIAQYFFKSSSNNSSLILDDINKCLQVCQLMTCLKMLLLDRINNVIGLLDNPDVTKSDVYLLNGIIVFKKTNETNETEFSDKSSDDNDSDDDDLSIDDEIAVKVFRMFRNRTLRLNLFPNTKVDIVPQRKEKEFLCFTYRVHNEVESTDVEEESEQTGRKRKNKGGGMSMFMMLPQLIMMGLMPFTLASLKAMVMNAVMINMMALNGAIFMTIRNLVFGPRQGDNVQYVNYGYSKDRQKQRRKPSLIIHSAAAFVKQPEVHKKPVHHHYHPGFGGGHHTGSGFDSDVIYIDDVSNREQGGHGGHHGGFPGGRGEFVEGFHVGQGNGDFEGHYNGDFGGHHQNYEIQENGVQGQIIKIHRKQTETRRYDKIGQNDRVRQNNGIKQNNRPNQDNGYSTINYRYQRNTTLQKNVREKQRNYQKTEQTRTNNRIVNNKHHPYQFQNPNLKAFRSGQFEDSSSNQISSSNRPNSIDSNTKQRITPATWSTTQRTTPVTWATTQRITPKATWNTSQRPSKESYLNNQRLSTPKKSVANYGSGKNQVESKGLPNYHWLATQKHEPSTTQTVAGQVKFGKFGGHLNQMSGITQKSSWSNFPNFEQQIVTSSTQVARSTVEEPVLKVGQKKDTNIQKPSWSNTDTPQSGYSTINTRQWNTEENKLQTLSTTRTYNYTLNPEQIQTTYQNEKTSSSHEPIWSTTIQQNVQVDSMPDKVFTSSSLNEKYSDTKLQKSKPHKISGKTEFRPSPQWNPSPAQKPLELKLAANVTISSTTEKFINHNYEES